LEIAKKAQQNEYCPGPFKAEIRVRFPLALPNNLQINVFESCAIQVISLAYYPGQYFAERMLSNTLKEQL
jgi:hypothetical protein